MPSREKVPLFVLPDQPGPIALSPRRMRPRVFIALTPNEVSAVVGGLVLLNVVLAVLITGARVPGWLGARLSASDLDVALMMGTFHVGLSCCAILFAGRALFRRHGLTGRLYAMAAVACLGTAFSLGRIWVHPIRTGPTLHAPRAARAVAAESIAPPSPRLPR